VSKDTRENRKGDIVFPDGTVLKGADGEQLEGISILAHKTVRVYFPQPFNPNNTFVCRSIDGKTGHSDGKFPGRTCSTCEFAKYPKEGGASPCREQRLLFCTKPDGSMFHLQISGVGVKEWSNFVSSQLSHLLAKHKPGLPLMFNLTLGVKQIDTANGMFPAISFKTNPNNLFVSQERFKENIDLAKVYAKIAQQQAETSAGATREFIEADASPSGSNSDLF
jgi:hypothetical protein